MSSPAANAVEQYVAAMRMVHALGAHTAETTFYTPLANFFNAVGATLKPRVHFQAHPGSHGAGIVDGGFFPLQRTRQSEPLPNERPERGAVEIKPAGTSMDVLARSEQVRRYLENYGLCLITNFHQFRLLELRNGQPHTLEAYTLTERADDFWSLPLRDLVAQHAETLPDYLQRVMTRKVPLAKPKDVASLLASYAREARARATQHEITAFSGVKNALQEALGITFEGEKGEHFFRSTLIQTLFYGIFSAWVLWKRTEEGRRNDPPFNWRLSADYLRIPVLRALFHAVSDRGALNTVQIIEVLDHANDALNRVEPEFFATFNEEDAVNYFYEPFLEAFDPDLRKQLGVWYTPREIVRYMVERVDHLLRTELNEPLGLASPNVQVLDPCCGTGAYLVEVLHRIHRTLREEAGDDSNYVGSDLRKAATTRVFGFEIMPAPFVIAHLQVAHLLEQAGASLREDERAKVFLTNALTGWVPVRHPQSTFGFPALVAERDQAEAVKQADTILVILGNPPYNGYAGIAQIEEERGLTTAYRVQMPGLNAPQGQGLNDLYVRFFRIAERRVVGDREAKGNTGGRGLVSFISNNAWLDGLSHVSMRARYLQQFQSIYIDNLHGDKYRTGKTTPDGKPDPSAFSTPQNREGIQVGTAVTTLVRVTAGHPLEKTVSLRNLWGTHKLSHLERETRREASPIYKGLTPASELGLAFADRLRSEDYTNWPTVPDLLPIAFAGIKTSRDALLVDIDRTRLEARMRNYADQRISNETLLRDYPSSMDDTARFSATKTREAIIRRGFRAWQIVRDTYRPFDVRWLYWEPTTKLLDEKREELVSTFVPYSPFLIAQQKTRMAPDPPQIVSTLCDLAIMDRSASLFPLLSLEHTAGLLGLPEMAVNISAKAQKYLVDLSSHPEELFYHALGTMHTPKYRTENAGALLDSWPRIPLPATAELLEHSAGMGRRLAELLDPESDVQLQREWSFLARLQLPPELPEGAPERDRRNAARFALTAGWGGRGQGETVMPRRGKAPERDWTATELDRLRWPSRKKPCWTCWVRAA